MFTLPVATAADGVYDLSWRVNCSTPLISYELEFREMPHGNWLSLNVPGTDAFSSRHVYLWQPDRLHTLHKRATKSVRLFCGYKAQTSRQGGVALLSNILAGKCCKESRGENGADKTGDAKGDHRLHAGELEDGEAISRHHGGVVEHRQSYKLSGLPDGVNYEVSNR